jgi:hypothetical protein
MTLAQPDTIRNGLRRTEDMRTEDMKREKDCLGRMVIFIIIACSRFLI